MIPAVKPETPPKPVYISSSATEIALQFDRSPDNGGVAILNYELWIERSSIFELCSTYDYVIDGYSFTVIATTN